MQKVLDRYIKQISKQLKRRNRREQGNSFTSNEEKAITSYGRAAQALQALIDAPTPAWAGVPFSKDGKFLR